MFSFFLFSFLWVYYFNFFSSFVTISKGGGAIYSLNCFWRDGDFHEPIGISPCDGFSWVLLNSFFQISYQYLRPQSPVS